jgi:hypothetical protein
VARHFRRLDDSGLWERLLRAVRIARPGTPLAALRARAVCRACRKLRGARGIRMNWLARALRVEEALPAPPECCANPFVSVYLRERPPALCFVTAEEMLRTRYHEVRAEIRVRKWLHDIARGPRWVPPQVRRSW